MYTSLFSTLYKKVARYYQTNQFYLKLLNVCLLLNIRTLICIVCMFGIFRTVILIYFDTAFVCFAFRYDTTNVSFK